MNTEEMSLMELGMKFYFVIKNGLKSTDEVSPDMNAAYANIRDYVPDEESIVWMKEDEVRDFAAKNSLTKKSVFVLDSFSDRAFDFLQGTKALIIGPRCMLSCLMENASVPLGASPVFTTAMRNLVICASGLPSKEKDTIRYLVQWMGGYYADDLSGNCTHLISITVKSEKYEKAALKGIPIMHPDWVHKVWSLSKKETILATSEVFDKHKLPIFYSLVITTSSLTNAVKNNLMKLINENGGVYAGQFKSSQTDILITEKGKTDSQKFRAAMQYKKDCLIPEWITDSVKKGYALPTEHYKVANMKVSTPNKMSTSVSATDFNPDCTQLSEISRAERTRINSTVNESLSSVASTVSRMSSASRALYKDILAGISTQLARKVGAFLDGCCIYLTGFTADEKEKLNKILNVGGAIRYDEMNEKITHCIAGEPTQNDLNKISEHGVQVLTLDWLAESLRNGLPVSEENFIYKAVVVAAQKAPEPPSPSSKMTIESMNHSFKKPSVPKSRIDLTRPSTSKRLDMDQFADEQNEFLSQYTRDNSATLPPPKPDLPPVTTTMPSDQSDVDTELCTEEYNNLNFFIGYTVHIHDHEEDCYQQLTIDCENAGARVVDKGFNGIADYAIVPSEQAVDVTKVAVKAKHIVNNIWFEDAMKDNKVVDILYYHEPIPITADSKPLTGLVVVISLYSNMERLFIEWIATALGASKKENYAKKHQPLLICSEPKGAKYDAAIKWKYPVVTSQWLVDCAREGKKISLEPYLVGASEISTTGIWVAFGDQDDSLHRNDSSRRGNATKKSNSREGDTTLSDNKSPQTSKTSLIKKSTRNGSYDSENDFTLARQSSLRNGEPGFDVRSIVQMERVENDPETVKTPDGVAYLRHRRLSELTETGRKRTRLSSGSPLPTPPPPGALNISDLVKEVSTPNRELLYNVLKEMQSKETPESQRIRKLVATPGAQTKTPQTPKIPEFVTTPQIRKRRIAYADKYYLPPTKPRTPATPFSEVKKRFWKEALGDQYFEEGNYNTQTFSQILGDDATTSTGLRGSGDTQQLVDMNIHVKQLSDFINNRDAAREKRNIHELPEIETEAAVHRVDSEFCGTEEMIGWRDPSEFSEEQRLQARGMKFRGTPRFSISCQTDKTKETIIEQIKKLRGEVCENLLSFDETCTHIVCQQPNRGQKVLSGIASGKWILGLNYIEDSVEAGHFLDEELYEWGNPKATNLPKLPDDEQKIANAGFRWRTKINFYGSTCKGAFQGFNVIICAPEPDRFEKLIHAGGGKVLNIKEPYANSTEALKATHCFVQQKKKLLPNDFRTLKNAGVLILSVIYLNVHLTSEVKPDYTKYLLSEG